MSFASSSTAGRPARSAQTCELFKDDVCYHKQIVSKHFCILRGSGIRKISTLPSIHSNASRIHYRSLASITSIPVRNQSFAMINGDDISYFKKILGERGVVQEEEKLDDANTDWMRKYKGSSKLMLQPRTAHEVSVLF